MKHAHPLALCVLAALAACDGQDVRTRVEPGVAGQFAPAATAEAAARGDAALTPAGYRLSLDRVRRVIDAQRNLAVAAGVDAQLAVPQGTEPLDEQVAQIEAAPALREAVARAGLSAREQVVASWVLAQAAIAQGVIDAGATPETVLGSIRIDSRNVEFYRGNREVIERLQKAAADEVNEGEVIPGSPSAELEN